MIWAWSLVIFLIALAAIGGPAWWIGRGNRKLDRTTLLARLEEGIGRAELPRAGRFDVDWWPEPGAGFRSACYPPHGPFTVDTGPLLIVSETTAAGVALNRYTRGLISETDWLIEAAERKIGPVQP